MLGGWLLLKCSAIGIGFDGAENKLWNCTHFRHPTNEQLRHVDIFFSDFYNLQSVHFELLQAVDSGFQVLDSRSLVRGAWIPDSIVSRSLDSLNSITDSKAQDFSGFQNPN